jgi:hypothetical protein
MKPVNQKILKDSQIEFYLSNNDYSSAADHLFKSQLHSRALLKKTYGALEDVQTKSFRFDGFKLNVQFNPERIKSTSAVVDESSIKNRKCFLCTENLPDDQKGILLAENYLLLCNPYPVFPRHFTISSLLHKPQSITDSFSDLLQVAKLLSQRYTLVYNGPACGASAPDHLHFQAGTKYFLPVEDDIQQLKNDFGKVVRADESVVFSFVDDGLRRFVFIESAEQPAIESSFKIFYEAYAKISKTGNEPMMNILCGYEQEFGWSVIIFLRSSHRPECFYKDDPEKLLISPAAIDLGGIVVTPRESDYLRVDKDMLHQIFNEVSLDQKTFSLLEGKIKFELS